MGGGLERYFEISTIFCLFVLLYKSSVIPELEVLNAY